MQSMYASERLFDLKKIILRTLIDTLVVVVFFTLAITTFYSLGFYTALQSLGSTFFFTLLLMIGIIFSAFFLLFLIIFLISDVLRSLFYPGQFNVRFGMIGDTCKVERKNELKHYNLNHIKRFEVHFGKWFSSPHYNLFNLQFGSKVVIDFTHNTVSFFTTESKKLEANLLKVFKQKGKKIVRTTNYFPVFKRIYEIS